MTATTAPGDALIDMTSAEHIRARVRAIVIHRRYPDLCAGHQPGEVAVHFRALDEGDDLPLDRLEAETDVHAYAAGVAQAGAFEGVRLAEDARLADAREC